MEREKFKKKQSTSWEPVQKWYDSAVGKDGLYYHKQVILPGVLNLMQLQAVSSPAVLDLACGQGILGRYLPQDLSYIGIDLSKSLIRHAQKEDLNPNHRYFVGDVTQPFPKKEKLFSQATIILAVQNIEKPYLAFKEATKHLTNHGKLIIVLNHPCFRVPRQSSWQVDPNKK